MFLKGWFCNIVFFFDGNVNNKIFVGVIISIINYVIVVNRVLFFFKVFILSNSVIFIVFSDKDSYFYFVRIVLLDNM